MVNLLHLAGAHLGAPLYVSTDALLKRMRAAQRTALRRAVDCALREAVDAVLIAGGLFDERHLDVSAQQFLVKQLTRLDEAGIRSFYATGPLDSGGASSRGAEIGWPPSLHRFTDPAPQAVMLEGEDGQPLARVVGAGHAGPGTASPRRADFPDPQGRMPHVGLLHAAPPDAPKMRSQPSEAPAGDQQKEPPGYAYWALGGAPSPPVTDAPDGSEAGDIWNAGPLVGRGPAEPGAQGGLLVTLAAGQAPEVSFRPFAPLCWADVLLDELSGTGSQHALLQRAQQAFAERAAGDDRAAWLARFTLSGACPLAPSLREEKARARLEEALAEHLDLEAAFVRLHHRLTPEAAPERHRAEPHVLGEALALLDRAEADPALLRELAPAELAAAPGSADDDPEDSDTGAYLRERAEALDREACARLLRESSFP